MNLQPGIGSLVVKAASISSDLRAEECICSPKVEVVHSEFAIFYLDVPIHDRNLSLQA